LTSPTTSKARWLGRRSTVAGGSAQAETRGAGRATTNTAARGTRVVRGVIFILFWLPENERGDPPTIPDAPWRGRCPEGLRAVFCWSPGAGRGVLVGTGVLDSAGFVDDR